MLDATREEGKFLFSWFPDWWLSQNLPFHFVFSKMTGNNNDLRDWWLETFKTFAITSNLHNVHDAVPWHWLSDDRTLAFISFIMNVMPAKLRWAYTLKFSNVGMTTDGTQTLPVESRHSHYRVFNPPTIKHCVRRENWFLQMAELDKTQKLRRHIHWSEEIWEESTKSCCVMSS